MTKNLKRVNILITHEEYAEISKRGLNLSGLVRDLLHDRLSGAQIVLSISAQTRAFYDNVISNFGATDKDLEPYIVEALDRFLEHRGKEINAMRKKLKRKL
jgi:hypothetical protein